MYERRDIIPIGLFHQLSYLKLSYYSHFTYLNHILLSLLSNIKVTIELTRNNLEIGDCTSVKAFHSTLHTIYIYIHVKCNVILCVYVRYYVR